MKIKNIAKLFNTPSEQYWQKQVRWVSKNRLAWFGEEAQEDFWLRYWEVQLKEKTYYQSAYNLDLNNSPVGRILLKELAGDGFHLEAGCGAGYWVAVLGNAGYNILGIEYSKPLVALVKSVYPGIPIEYGNALAISSPDNYYDSYISFGVVEHDIKGPQEYLREAYRVVKPGGKIVISVPHWGFIRKLKSKMGMYSKQKPTLPFFQYGFGQDDFIDILLKSGFRVQSVHLSGDINRLLVEEISFYHWMSYQRGGTFLRKVVNKLFSQYDGHMIIFVGIKSYASN